MATVVSLFRIMLCNECHCSCKVPHSVYAHYHSFTCQSCLNEARRIRDERCVKTADSINQNKDWITEGF